jgi:hypothetical protein
MFKRVYFWLLLLMFVIPASITQAKNSGGTRRDSLFIEASIDNRKPWVGQEVVLTYTLFFSDVAPRIEDNAKPEHPGLWVQEVNPENYIKSTPAAINGTILRKAVVKQLKLVPMQSGKLSVTNYRLGCFLPKNSQVTLDSRNDVETIITAPSAIIEARALPQPAPEGFSGAVGSFSVTVSPEKSRVHTGEPLTLFITVNGRGNLKTLPPLALNLPQGLRKMESAVPTLLQDRAGQPDESVTTRITLSAEETGTFRFIPVRMTFFDPWKGRYETIEAKEIAISVIPGKGPAQEQRAYTTPEKPSGRFHLPFSSSIMLTMAATVIALIFGLHARGKNLLQRKPPIQTVNQPAPSSPPVHSVLLSAESLRSRLFDALKQLGIPNPAGLITSELKKKLEENKVQEKTASALLELLAKIDHAIYTPGDTSPEKLDALNRSSSIVLADLARH